MARGVKASTADVDGDAWEGFLDMTDVAPGAAMIEVADSTREFKEVAEYEAFMNERIGIVIAEANTAKEMPLVPVGVNGDQKWLPRDRPIVVRRHHLERLLRASQAEFKVKPLPDKDLDEGQRTESRNLPSYHIQVLRDDNPMGVRWMARMRREGC